PAHGSTGAIAAHPASVSSPRPPIASSPRLDRPRAGYRGPDRITRHALMLERLIDVFQWHSRVRFATLGEAAESFRVARGESPV
ncbi:MAG: hypothetical protein M3R02_20765, partial [Chloroflexota bacterium]|nr:hypothetical protein [Chloroflexota bacterium]